MCRQKTMRGDIRGEKAKWHGSRSGFAPRESPLFVSLSSPLMTLLLQSTAQPHGTNRSQGLFLEMQRRDVMRLSFSIFPSCLSPKKDALEQ